MPKKLRRGGHLKESGSKSANLSPLETRLHCSEPGGAFAPKNCSVPVRPKARVVGQKSDINNEVDENGLIEKSKLKLSRQIDNEDSKNDLVMPQNNVDVLKSPDIVLKLKNPGDSNRHLLSNQSSAQDTGTKVKVNLLGCHSQTNALSLNAVPQDGGVMLSNSLLRGSTQQEGCCTGKVKKLIMNFEKKKLEEERKGGLEKNGKERGVKKIGRKKTTSSTSSPALKKSLKSLNKPHQKTIVDFWGPERCTVGSPKNSKKFS